MPDSLVPKESQSKGGSSHDDSWTNLGVENNVQTQNNVQMTSASAAPQPKRQSRRSPSRARPQARSPSQARGAGSTSMKVSKKDSKKKSSEIDTRGRYHDAAYGRTRNFFLTSTVPLLLAGTRILSSGSFLLS